ncbi:hypothetical protein M153_823000374 [Pseudoloma neurophilia]|uniref:Uncharacterized protein n=1 Tax=Pseudoloma neurophilia TaxID=146866 RepID=A0A0R0M502_9MICR|nr:hypothetical protein M153_823000374 [Pseudoloma neurophilia]
MISIASLYPIFHPLLLTRAQFELIQQKISTKEQAVIISNRIKLSHKGAVKILDEVLLKLLNDISKLDFYFLTDLAHDIKPESNELLFDSINAMVKGRFIDGKLHSFDETVLDLNILLNRSSLPDPLKNLLLENMIIGFDPESNQIRLPHELDHVLRDKLCGLSSYGYYLQSYSQITSETPWLTFSSSGSHQSNFMKNAQHAIFANISDREQSNIKKSFTEANSDAKCKFLNKNSKIHKFEIDQKRVIVISDMFEQRYRQQFIDLTVQNEENINKDCYFIFYTLLLSQLVLEINGKLQLVFDCADILIIDQKNVLECEITLPDLKIYTGQQIKIFNY